MPALAACRASRNIPGTGMVSPWSAASFTSPQARVPAMSPRVGRVLPSLVVVLAAALAGCAGRPPRPGTPLRPQVVTLSYACTRIQSLRVRMNQTSAAVTVDGDGPYTLSLVTARPELQQFTNGQYTLRIADGETFFGGTRGALQSCTRT